MDRTAVIFGSVPEKDWSFLRAYLPEEPALVICADGGIRSARAAGLRPGVLIGDGDSGGEPEEGVRFLPLNPEKDYSDMHAAVRFALDGGVRRMLLLGCSGGRADHYLANVCLLETIAAGGAAGMLLDSGNEITYFAGGRLTLCNRPPYRYFGLLPIDDVISGVTLRGMKYPLTDAVVRRGDTLSISNEPSAPVMTVEVRRGRAFLVRSERTDLPEQGKRDSFQPPQGAGREA